MANEKNGFFLRLAPSVVYWGVIGQCDTLSPIGGEVKFWRAREVLLSQLGGLNMRHTHYLHRPRACPDQIPGSALRDKTIRIEEASVIPLRGQW
jgi:hypothetical protein